MASGAKFQKLKKRREVIMNLGKEELTHRVKITVPLLEQVSKLSAKKKSGKKNFRLEIEAKRDELLLAREFAL